MTRRRGCKGVVAGVGAGVFGQAPSGTEIIFWSRPLQTYNPPLILSVFE